MYCDLVSPQASAVLRIYWICEPNMWFKISLLFCICHNSNIVQAHEVPTPQLWKSSTQPSGSTEGQELMLCQGGVNCMYGSWSCGYEKCLYREKNGVLTHGGGRRWKSTRQRKGKWAKHYLVRPPSWIGTAAWCFLSNSPNYQDSSLAGFLPAPMSSHPWYSTMLTLIYHCISLEYSFKHYWVQSQSLLFYVCVNTGLYPQNLARRSLSLAGPGHLSPFPSLL